MTVDEFRLARKAVLAAWNTSGRGVARLNPLRALAVPTPDEQFRNALFVLDLDTMGVSRFDATDEAGRPLRERPSLGSLKQAPALERQDESARPSLEL